MKMLATIENYTRFPLAVIQAVVAWVLSELGVDRQDVIVRVYYTEHWHHQGHFYSDEPFVRSAGFEHMLVLKLPGELGYPYNHGLDLEGGPPRVDPRSWDEALVCICAHEGTHLVQLLGPPRTASYVQMRGGVSVMVDGSKLYEVDAEWAEYRLLALYRERRT